MTAELLVWLYWGMILSIDSRAGGVILRLSRWR